MNVLQEKMLAMLGEIDDICRKHKIEYCLFAGSGLGAERHSGFIPWDDDADIVMTLDNYEKFLRVFDGEAKEGRTLNCLEKSSAYPFTYARYVDTTTAAIQRHSAFGGCDPGIKIDIFFVVPTYDDLKKAEKHRLEILAFSEVICPYAIMHHYRPEGYADAYKAEKKLFDRLGREKYIARRMPKLKEIKKSGSSRCVLFSGMMSNSYILDTDIFDEIEYVRFENTELPVSMQNIKLTRELYGERWISKPKTLDIPRHTYLLDTERPYNEYLDKLWNKCDYRENERNTAARRDMHIYERDTFKDVFINDQRLRNLAVKLGTDNAYSKLNEGEKAAWPQLSQLFENYYNVQLKSINKHYNLFIDLNNDTFKAAMDTAVMTDRYYDAADILKIGDMSGSMPYTGEMMQDIRERIDTCRKITETLYIENDLNKTAELIDDIADPLLCDSLTVKTASLWLRAAEAAKHDASQGNAFDELLAEVDLSAEAYGFPGELLAVKGYCLEITGQLKEAEAVYEKAAKNTCNGFVYQWLADKGFITYEYKYE